MARPIALKNKIALVSIMLQFIVASRSLAPLKSARLFRQTAADTPPAHQIRRV
jgi:hypothetical protein